MGLAGARIATAIVEAPYRKGPHWRDPWPVKFERDEKQPRQEPPYSFPGLSIRKTTAFRHQESNGVLMNGPDAGAGGRRGRRLTTHALKNERSLPYWW